MKNSLLIFSTPHLSTIMTSKDIVRVACKWCHGMGYRETGNDTIECDKCNGAGSIETKGKQ